VASVSRISAREREGGGPYSKLQYNIPPRQPLGIVRACDATRCRNGDPVAPWASVLRVALDVMRVSLFQVLLAVVSFCRHAGCLGRPWIFSSRG
jgi:hypothetical protein